MQIHQFARHRNLKNGTLKNFAPIAAISAAVPVEPPINLSDLISDAALYALENGKTFADAWQYVTRNCKTKPILEIPDYFFGETSNVAIPKQLTVEIQDIEPTMADPEWLVIISARLHRLSKLGTGTQRNYALRSIKILEFLCELVDDEENTPQENQSLIFQFAYEGISSAPRAQLYKYILSRFKENNDPISMDYLKHTWMYLQRELEPIVTRGGVSLKETQRRKK